MLNVKASCRPAEADVHLPIIISISHVCRKSPAIQMMRPGVSMVRMFYSNADVIKVLS